MQDFGITLAVEAMEIFRVQRVNAFCPMVSCCHQMQVIENGSAANAPRLRFIQSLKK